MLKRSFEVLNVDLEMLNLLGAFQILTKKTADGKAEEECFSCSISYEQSKMLPRSRKRNTQLFEQLNEIIEIQYELSHDVLPHFLYECIFVDMNVHGTEATLCLLEKGGDDGTITAVRPVSSSEVEEKITRNLFANGFTITGVPRRDKKTKLRQLAGNGVPTEDIHYRAFIASASMARKGIYLFVNEEHYKELMERLSLGFFSFDKDRKQITLPQDLFKDSFRISPAKISAYLGLSLSDGVSMQEARVAWSENEALKRIAPPKLTLNENTVFVAHDLKIPAKRLYPKNGSHVWRFCETDAVMFEDNCELEDAKADSLMAFFRELMAPSRSTWDSDSIGCTKDCLNTWYAIVSSFLENAEDSQLAWENPLPSIPEDEKQFKKNLHHYAYLLAVLLYSKLRGRPKPLWEQSDSTAECIQKCIDALISADEEVAEAVRKTALALKDNKDTLSISTSVDDASGDSTTPSPKKIRNLSVQTFSSKTKKYEARLVPAKELTEKINMFDGIGLCEPETFDMLEMLLLRTDTLGEKRRYSALIIRLPWLKGVLVRVDFQSFFKDKNESKELPEKIKDIFGKERKLDEIKIIINQSMLKGYSYLRNLLETSKEDFDPWQYYWQRIEQYDYSLLITGRNSPAGNVANINSQFLSTNPLSDSEMKKLLDRNIGKLRDLLKEENRLQFYLSKSAAKPDETPEGKGDGDAPDDEGEKPSEAAAESFDTDAAFGAALRSTNDSVQRALLKTRYAKSSLQSHIRSRLLDCLQGRLKIHADYRFVAPDLLFMLYYLMDRYVLKKAEVISGTTSPDTYYAEEFAPTDALLNQFCPMQNAAESSQQPAYHGHGFFYAPGLNTPWDGKNEICVLRNPHYALGEGVIVTSLSAQLANAGAKQAAANRAAEYDRWFSELDSVIMLPATAIASIGGADCDGDRCLCVAEPTIVNALKTAIKNNYDSLLYILDHSELYTSFLNQQLEALDGKPPAVAQYLTRIKAWMSSCLPSDRKQLRTGNGYCPPLVFGLDNHGIDFSIHEQKSDGAKTIDEHLLDTFLMTTKQEIGKLSVEALSLTDSAYSIVEPYENNATVLLKGKTPEQQEFTESDLMRLRHWLFHWRVVSLALENGAEIDMAKTGVRAIPTELRTPITIDTTKESLETIARLEEHHTSILRIITEQIKSNPSLSKLTEKEFADALRGMMNEEDTSTRESFIQLGEKRQQKPHHNAHLIPCLIYQSIMRPTNDTGALGNTAEATGKPAPSPFIPMSESSGKALRELFSTEKKKYAPRDMASGSDTRKTNDEAELEKLVWAKKATRAQAISDFITSTLQKSDATTGKAETAKPSDFHELVSDEQGIYFFKEALKYMHYSQATAISDELDKDAAKTPAALRKKLLDILGSEENLLNFLIHYEGQHFDARINRYVYDINDFLFLALADDAFAAACKALNDQKNPKKASAGSADSEPSERTDGEPTESVALPCTNNPIAQAEDAVRAYIQYKGKLVSQADNIQKIKIRYAYCLRNLQRRFSLIQAYNIINRYNHGYASSPLCELGIPADRMKQLLSQLEKRKE